MGRIRYLRRVKAAPHVAGIVTPVNTVLPVITGDTAGDTSTTTDGTWSNASAFKYQWYLDGVAIAEETTNSIDTDVGWVGQTLTVVVSGCNGAGCVEATADGVVLQEAPSYTGPLDLVPGAFVAYGNRAMAGANIGSAVYTVRRDSDDATQVFNSQSDGSVDVSTVTNFLGGANGFIASWNDKGSSGANLVQATGAKQPSWIASANNNIPGLQFLNAPSATVENLQATVNCPGASTFFCVYKRNSVGAINQNAELTSIYDAGFDNYIYLDSGSWIGPDRALSVDQLEIDPYAETTGISSTNALLVGSYILVEMSISSSNLDFKINGTAISVVPFKDGVLLGFADGTLNLGGYVDTSGLNGIVQELIWYPTELSAEDRTLIRQNIATYYGITLG